VSVRRSEIVRFELCSLTVGGSLDRVRKGGDSDNKSLLDLLENLLVLIVRYKGDTKTLGTESSSTADSVQVRVSVGGRVLLKLNMSDEDHSMTCDIQLT
jgi:hypothetical protein